MKRQKIMNNSVSTGWDSTNVILGSVLRVPSSFSATKRADRNRQLTEADRRPWEETPNYNEITETHCGQSNSSNL